jgi:hypothetical protein
MEQPHRNNSEITLGDWEIPTHETSNSSSSGQNIQESKDVQQNGTVASNNDLENGQSEKQTPPHKKLPSIFSPQLKKDRIILLKSIMRVEILLVIIVLGILSLYWGGLASIVPNQRVLTVAIVDFDGQEVGNALTQFGILDGRAYG